MTVDDAAKTAVLALVASFVAVEISVREIVGIVHKAKIISYKTKV